MLEFTPSNIRLWSRLGSCGAYGQAMLEVPNIADNAVACTADLCYYSGLERFKDEYPDRLYNVGIAEQNLLGIAAGLAKEGFNPFVSTYASFATTRALDQVRTNMSYMGMPIKLIGLTAGYSVGILGATHMSVEDIGVMRSLPGITILSPADTTETVKTILALANYDKPAYVRLTGTMGSPVVYNSDFDYKIERANIIRKGQEIAIIAIGSMVSCALKASQLLEGIGISCTVIDMQVIKPIDESILQQISNHKLWVTIEEHSRNGGIGTAIAEYVTDHRINVVIKRMGLDDKYPHAGDYKYLLERSALTSENICNSIIRIWEEL